LPVVPPVLSPPQPPLPAMAQVPVSPPAEPPLLRLPPVPGSRLPPAPPWPIAPPELATPPLPFPPRPPPLPPKAWLPAVFVLPPVDVVPPGPPVELQPVKADVPVGARPRKTANNVFRTGEYPARRVRCLAGTMMIRSVSGTRNPSCHCYARSYESNLAGVRESGRGERHRSSSSPPELPSTWRILNAAVRTIVEPRFNPIVSSSPTQTGALARTALLATEKECDDREQQQRRHPGLARAGAHPAGTPRRAVA